MQRRGQVKHVRLHERGVQPDVGGECAGGGHGFAREVHARHAGTSARPRQRVHPEVALEMKKVEAIDGPDFFDLDRLEGRCALAERFYVVKRRVGMERRPPVPERAVGL